MRVESAERSVEGGGELKAMPRKTCEGGASRLSEDEEEGRVGRENGLSWRLLLAPLWGG